MALVYNLFEAGRAKEAVSKFYANKIKIALVNKDIWYNHQCLKNEVIPNYVGIKIATHSKAARIASELGRIKWVKTEINDLHARKQRLYEEVYKLHLEIQNNQYEDKHEHNKEKFMHSLNFKLQRKQTILDKKLEHLISVKNKSFNSTGDGQEGKHVFYERTKNLTNVQLNSNEKRILDKGLKYNLADTYKHKDCLKQTIVDCERALLQVDYKERNHARHLLLEKLQKVKQQPIKYDRNELITTNNLKKKLKEHNVLILKADKGNTTVLMNKQEYIDKTEQFISANDILEIKKDPTIKFQNNIKNCVNRTNLIMDKNDRLKAINPNPKIPNLRAAPKIHKENTPIRPIINFRNAPSYKASVFMHKYLKNNLPINNNRSIKNSADLINKLKEINYDNDTKFASLDISSMYTCVPVKETIDIIKDGLLRNNISVDETEEVACLLQTILHQNYFSFNNKMYKQQEGLAMGSPLSGILADIFLNHIEQQIIQQLRAIDDTIKWYRYVDDVILIYNSTKFNTQEILDIANRTHNKINFTKEDEIDNKINYLDITIHRMTTQVNISVYRKKTTTSHVIHFSSCHPNEHKQAAFRYYLNRAHNIPNSEANRKNEFNTIEQIAVANGYNKSWLNNLETKISKKKQIKADENKDKKYASFTYINAQTNKVTQVLRNKYKINIAYKTKNNLSNIIGKHNLSEQNSYNNSGVYMLTCQHAECGCNYVGLTSRSFKCRYKEHKNSVRYNRGTAFGNHVFDENHAFTNIDTDMKIIKLENKGIDLFTREAIEIYLKKHDDNNLNEQNPYGDNILFQVL